MKGIVLAGGTGSRLRPLTLAVCKQLLPVYDKPMVYYPLSNLLLAGIHEICVISTPADLPLLRRLLGDGSRFGASLCYVEQQAPRGIAEALLLAEDWLAGEAVALVLGDNLIYGQGLTEALQDGARLTDGALIFGTAVAEPSRYGVLAFDGSRVVDVVEKPASPPSRFAVPGLYFYDGTAPARARALRPSARGELEITDLNRAYLAEGKLAVKLFGRGMAWLDMGTPESLAQAAVFVQTLQDRQHVLGQVEVVQPWRRGLLDDDGLRASAASSAGTAYGDYLLGLLEGG